MENEWRRQYRTQDQGVSEHPFILEDDLDRLPPDEWRRLYEYTWDIYEVDFLSRNRRKTDALK